MAYGRSEDCGGSAVGGLILRKKIARALGKKSRLFVD